MSSDLFLNASLLVLRLHIREQIALLHEFQHDEEDLHRAAILLNVEFALGVVLHHFQDVWVVERLQQRHLVRENFLEGFCEVFPFDVALFENFDGEKPAGFLAFGEFDPERLFRE